MSLSISLVCDLINQKVVRQLNTDLMSRFVDDGCYQYLNEGFDDLQLSKRFLTLSGHHHRYQNHRPLLSNIMCIADAQMKLLKCWRNFLELYVPLGIIKLCHHHHDCNYKHFFRYHTECTCSAFISDSRDIKSGRLIKNRIIFANGQPRAWLS